jgi:2-octaprenyl-3-methyl-6-methoxy-1,4-benzoquinol hydroxylase
MATRADWASPSRLARWARARRSEDTLAAHAFDGINRLYTSDSMAAVLLRGPLALLPFADGRCSIVWTLPEAEAARVLALDDDTFGRELTRASDARLGELHAASPRAAFPLQRQLANDYLRGRVLVLGDAAHVVHPLAGQGVNLGLRDVAALEQSVASAMATRADWASPSRLVRWARARRSEDTLAAYAFDGINRLYTSDSVAAVLLRGPLLGAAGRLPPLPRLLWKHAAGI